VLDDTQQHPEKLDLARKYEAALKAAGVRFQAFRYPGTEHGFNNDTTPRYDADADKLSWDRTIAFFKAKFA
jgi:carboxymethylenebutenolidase